MRWLSYIYPQTIARFSSSFNKDIRVVEEHGRYKVLVSGSPQSGPYIEKLWENACSSFGIPKQTSPQSILVLGIAGGTVIHLLRRWYPNTPITAVDIDQVMIDVGRNFFGLGILNKVLLINDEAQKFVAKSLKERRLYDFIIVDLSFGREIPAFVATRKFLSTLKKLCADQGAVVINFLREREYKGISNTLKNTLLNFFPTVREKPIFLNRFFFAQ